MSTTATLIAPTTTQMTTASSSTPATQPSVPTTSTPASISNKLSNALRRNPGGNPGGSGGGGSGGGGGGAPAPQGPGGPNVPQNPIAQAADVKAMGALPQIFSGDCARADDFIEEVKTYLHLNDDVTGFNSPMKKLTFVLTLIKGPDVAGWCHNMGTFYDQLDLLIDNIPALWEQFLHKFEQQFQDTQKPDRARAKLEGLCMCFPNVDQYIAEFKELAWQVGYIASNIETIHLFTKGLTQSIMEDVLKPPHVHDYQGIKQKAIESTRSCLLIDQIIKSQAPGGNNSGFRGGVF